MACCSAVYAVPKCSTVFWGKVQYFIAWLDVVGTTLWCVVCYSDVRYRAEYEVQCSATLQGVVVARKIQSTGDDVGWYL